MSTTSASVSKTNRGETIDLVFFKRSEFAIYQSSGKILVQYADDDVLAKEQIAKIAELLPLKDRLQYLVQNMDRPERYRWQIAESLRLGLYGQKDSAKSIMQGAIDDINGTHHLGLYRQDCFHRFRPSARLLEKRVGGRIAGGFC